MNVDFSKAQVQLDRKNSIQLQLDGDFSKLTPTEARFQRSQLQLEAENSRARQGETERGRARQARRTKLDLGTLITRLIVLVLCICAGLAKIATAYVVQTHDTKEL